MSAVIVGLTSRPVRLPSVGGNNGFVATQSYSYDSLNRLKQATEMITPHGGSQALSWRQTYTFDRYGNRRFDEGQTTTLPKNCGTPQNPTVCPEDVARLNPEINTANNRLSSPGWQYDAAGNTVRDAESRRFTYDGENKQLKVETVDANGNPTAAIGQYYFDGDGKRVKKVVPAGANGGAGETTIFVYDASGKLVAEFSTIVEPPATAKISYLTNDHLGSPRINTDANGPVTARHDYHPFGEEITTPKRTPTLGYANDTVRKQFTGYERDGETTIDYAKARMYGHDLGRFTSPDPVILASVADPQTWNKYLYALNSPFVFVDPNGLWPTEIHDQIIAEAFPGLPYWEMSRIQIGSFSVDFPGTILEINAPQHAMRNASLSEAKAKAEMNRFVTSNLSEAKALAGSNSVPTQRALFLFGKAMHPVMDNTSPAHQGFQLFQYSGFLLKDLFDLWQHKKRESTITPGQLTQTVQTVRDNYRSTFGERAYRRAVPVWADWGMVEPIRPMPAPRPPCKKGKGKCEEVTVTIVGEEDVK